MDYKTNIVIKEKFTKDGSPKYTAIMKRTYLSSSTYDTIMKEEFYKDGMLAKVVENFKGSWQTKKVIIYGFFKKVEQIINYRKDGTKRNIKIFSGNKIKISYFDNADNLLVSRIYTVEDDSNKIFSNTSTIIKINYKYENIW